MSVRSVFEFKFPGSAQADGLAVCKAIGKDMAEKNGYLSHEVIQDTKDAGHLIVSTQWNSEQDSQKVLSAYQSDEKIKKATELIGAPPTGYVGKLVS